jgi:hypothetical protein
MYIKLPIYQFFDMALESRLNPDQDPDPDWIWIWTGIQPKLLNPDTDLDQMNADLQP